MGSDVDGDDLTAGQTNKAQSGTELAVDQVELGNANDYILQVKHETVSPRVGAIRGIAGLFGVSGHGGDTGVFGEGSIGVQGEGKIGIQGKSELVAIDGVGGELGLRATGSQAGILAIAESNEGIGVLAVGQTGVEAVSPRNSNGVGVSGRGGMGVLGTGDFTGVVGSAVGRVGTGVSGSGFIGVHASSEKGFGLVAQGPASGFFSAAGYFIGQVVVVGDQIVSGAKSAAVPHADGSHRLLYALESPESWFEDFGEGSLVEGKAEITLDPEFAALVKSKKYHVFLTPCGDSRGLYVKRKTDKLFEVREQQGGKKNLKFSYRIVAKRKDIKGERLKKIQLPGSIPKRPEMPRLADSKQIVTKLSGRSDKSARPSLRRS
jgi:hypothetical protein